MMLQALLPQLPLPYDECRGMALVFAADLLPALDAVQAGNSSQHRASPVTLTDGRLMLCGDLLSEVGDGGLYATTLGRLDPSLLAMVDVMPWADAVMLLPPPEVLDG